MVRKNETREYLVVLGHVCGSGREMGGEGGSDGWRDKVKTGRGLPASVPVQRLELPQAAMLLY